MLKVLFSQTQKKSTNIGKQPYRILLRYKIRFSSRQYDEGITQMLPFGHLGFTLAFFHSSRTFRERINTYALAFGALLPDIIDKSIGQFIFSHGRFIGHSIIIGVTFCFLAGILFKIQGKNSNLAPSVFLGWTAHLIEDLGGFLPLFYPIIMYDFPISKLDLIMYFTTPYTVSCEIMGIILLSLLAYRYGYIDIIKEHGFVALIRVLLKLE